MEEVLRNVNKVMIDKNSSGAGGVVPYLPLPELKSGQPATACAAAHCPSGPGSDAMTNRSIIALIALAVAIFLVTQTFYTVDPTKQVLVRQFGAIVGDPKTEPGLYAKIPLVQDIQRIDRRLLDYEAEEFEIIAGDQKRLVVDAYARYKITGQAVRPDRAGRRGGPARAARFADQLRDPWRVELGAAACVLTDRRENLMDEITQPGERQDQGAGRRNRRRAHQACRFAAGQLPVGLQSNEDRPRARGRPAARRGRRGEGPHHRHGRPRGRRHQGRCRAQGPDLQGEADGEATRIYAQAFNKDKDFYAFYRRMEAYKQAFGAGGSTMILSPDTDFFRYFNDPAGPPAAKKKRRRKRLEKS